MADCDQHNEMECQAKKHYCGDLFGCGEENGTGVVRDDIKDAAVTRRIADRLLHMDELNQERLDGYLTARGQSRRSMLRASGFMGALAAVGPWFSRLAYASNELDGNKRRRRGPSAEEQR